MVKKVSIESVLLSITEKYKEEFIASFNGTNKAGTRNNNVKVLSDLQLMLVDELTNASQEYYNESEFSGKSKIDELKASLYKDFIMYATIYELTN